MADGSRSVWPRLLAVMAVIVAAACGAATPSSTARSSADGQSASVTASGNPEAATLPPENSAGGALPPSASLRVAEAPELHPGELGTYTFRGAGSDAPWLPARMLDAVQVQAGTGLTVSLEGGNLIDSWEAVVARSADEQGVQTTPLGQQTLPRPEAGAVFAAPESGSWVLAVSLGYADDEGVGVYFWRLEVT